jgi:SAM-dependent methyltransferase
MSYLRNVEKPMRKPTWAAIKEYGSLLWVNLTVQKSNLVEIVKVISKYYRNLSFAKLDFSLLMTYLFHNPFTISKRFLMHRGEQNVYAYGETPLTTLDSIVNTCRISDADTVFELGCGRGRTCFWLNCFIGCKVVGVEYIPDFVDRANRIKAQFHVDGVEFRNEDILDSDFSGATAFYIYGTCFEEDFIEKLIAKLSRLPAGTKIITVSYPLTHYTTKPLFEVMKRFPAEFTWGSADVYLQIRK